MRSKYVDKLWGFEEILVNDAQYCGKLLYLCPDFRSSIHYHTRKRETFVALLGIVILRLYDRQGVEKRALTLIGRGHESFTLEPGCVHSFETPSRDGAIVLEVSTYHTDADVTRLQESRRIG